MSRSLGLDSERPKVIRSEVCVRLHCLPIFLRKQIRETGEGNLVWRPLMGAPARGGDNAPRAGAVKALVAYPDPALAPSINSIAMDVSGI